MTPPIVIFLLFLTLNCHCIFHTLTTPTFLNAVKEAVVGWHGGWGVDDLLWDPQLLPDERMFEQSHLAQGKAVGGHPVGEHRLGGEAGSR